MRVGTYAALDTSMGGQKIEENVQWRDVNHYAETVDGSYANVYHLRSISCRFLRFLPLQ